MKKGKILNDHMEEPARLTPTEKTLKILFLKSGNQCAYPNCERPMYKNEILIGQICHIEDAKPGGRWNKSRSNEENRQEENLVLMCYEHHRETDNVEKYDTECMKRIKTTHEQSVTKSNTRTTVDFSGSKGISIIGSTFTGGAQVKASNTENLEIIDTTIDGNKNRQEDR